MRELQDGLDKAPTGDPPTIILWADEDAFKSGDLTLKNRYYCDDTKGSNYKKYLETLVNTAIGGYTQKIQGSCAFCGEPSQSEHARCGIPRCVRHRYIELSDFGTDNWDALFSARIDDTNHVADRLLTGYKKWHVTVNMQNQPYTRDCRLHVEHKRSISRLESPRFIEPMALMILLRTSDANREWLRSTKLVQAFCDEMKEGYKQGVDTLPMLAALGAVMLLKTGDPAVSLSVAESLLELNHHRWMVDPKDCVGALNSVKEGICTATEFADWLGDYIEPITGSREWAA